MGGWVGVCWLYGVGWIGWDKYRVDMHLDPQHSLVSPSA